MHRNSRRHLATGAIAVAASVVLFYACTSVGGSKGPNLAAGDAASRVYVAPGSYDQYYSFLSGGFSGQVTVYALPAA
jgi:nitrous-oxide reductase